MFMKQSMKAHTNLCRNINVLLALFQKMPKPSYSSCKYIILIKRYVNDRQNPNPLALGIFSWLLIDH